MYVHFDIKYYLYYKPFQNKTLIEIYSVYLEKKND